ncbi:MAG: hypothetical protein ACJ74Y_01115 [Bryobacteraceae bacterium]
MPFSDLFGMLQQYAGGGAHSAADPERDFDNVANNASRDHLASGIADSFRSDATPPFAQMISSLFSNSDGQQRAGILNHLLSAAGPAGAGGVLGNLLGGRTNSQVTPEDAQQISPQAVHDLAQQAEKNNPSILDTASQFYAQHPTLVKSLGAVALASVMSHMSRNQR